MRTEAERVGRPAGDDREPDDVGPEQQADDHPVTRQDRPLDGSY